MIFQSIYILDIFELVEFQANKPSKTSCNKMKMAVKTDEKCKLSYSARIEMLTGVKKKTCIRKLKFDWRTIFCINIEILAVLNGDKILCAYDCWKKICLSDNVVRIKTYEICNVVQQLTTEMTRTKQQPQKKNRLISPIFAISLHKLSAKLSHRN